MEGLVKEGLKKSETHKFTIGENFTVFIFGHSPHHLNVTGLKSFEHLKDVVKLLERKFRIRCSDTKIDNIFMSHKDNRNIKLANVYDYIQTKYKSIFYVDYNVELFPGMFLKPKLDGWPTIILFRTGSFQIMGGKNIQSIKKAYVHVQNIINYFIKSKL